MKNKIHLLLTLSVPLLLMNCSVKQNSTNPTRVTSTIPQQIIRNTQPSLGRPISIPRPIQRTSPRQNIPQVTLPTEQTFRTGKSYFSKKFKLPNNIRETSGLIKVDNRLWTHNDGGDKAALYQIDERTGRIIKTLKILNASNKDWEDIAYDDTYVYIGDMGNNRGNRRDLKIYKIPRAALRTQNSVSAEIIHFNYNDQKDFRSRPHKNNFDCEAIIAHHGKVYLFTKNWQDHKTRLYELDTTPGRHKARYISTFNVQGMVTGASINKELNILLLTTYSSLLDVNIWAFTNFRGSNMFKGNVKLLNFENPLLAQVEGITFTNNFKAYLSSESFKKYIITIDSALYEVDFSREFE